MLRMFFGFFMVIMNCFVLGLLGPVNTLGSGANVRRVTMSKDDGGETAEAEQPESDNEKDWDKADSTSDVKGTDSGDWCHNDDKGVGG